MPDRTPLWFYALNLAGGGADLSCSACLPEATRERGEYGGLVSVARVDISPGEYCGWCGVS